MPDTGASQLTTISAKSLFISVNKLKVIHSLFKYLRLYLTVGLHSGAVDSTVAYQMIPGLNPGLGGGLSAWMLVLCVCVGSLRVHQLPSTTLQWIDSLQLMKTYHFDLQRKKKKKIFLFFF